jgi:hypothetical protein
MPLPVRTMLLAVATLAAVAFAAVRITSAAEHRTAGAAPSTPERQVTPAEAAATLAKLRPPPGFRQIKDCRFRETNQKCFWTPRALLIDDQTMHRVVAFEQAQPRPTLLDSGCFAPHRWRGALVVRSCHAAVEFGPERITIFSESLAAPPGRPRTRTAAKAFRAWRRGTEIRMAVIGHWPHGTAPPSRY